MLLLVLPYPSRVLYERLAANTEIFRWVFCLGGFSMTRITGVPSLLGTATLLCRQIAKFRSLIYFFYPTNTALHAAYEAASVACSTLVAELTDVRELGD